MSACGRGNFRASEKLRAAAAHISFCSLLPRTSCSQHFLLKAAMKRPARRGRRAAASGGQAKQKQGQRTQKKPAAAQNQSFPSRCVADGRSCWSAAKDDQEGLSMRGMATASKLRTSWPRSAQDLKPKALHLAGRPAVTVQVFLLWGKPKASLSAQSAVALRKKCVGHRHKRPRSLHVLCDPLRVFSGCHSVVLEP